MSGVDHCFLWSVRFKCLLVLPRRTLAKTEDASSEARPKLEWYRPPKFQTLSPSGSSIGVSRTHSKALRSARTSLCRRVKQLVDRRGKSKGRDNKHCPILEWIIADKLDGSKQNKSKALLGCAPSCLWQADIPRLTPAAKKHRNKVCLSPRNHGIGKKKRRKKRNRRNN